MQQHCQKQIIIIDIYYNHDNLIVINKQIGSGRPLP